MKKKKSVFNKGSFSVAVLFVLGNAVIILPTASADRFALTGLVAALLFALITVLAFVPISCFAVIKESENVFLKAIKTFLLLATTIYSLFVAADTFADFTEFVKTLILPEIPKWIITAVFAATVLFFATKRQEGVLKFSLLCFLFAAVFVVIFFIALSGDFESEYIMYDRLPSVSEISDAAKPYLLKAALPTLVLPFYYKFALEDSGKNICFLGIAAGFGLLGLCVLSSVLLFSPALAGRLSYPYASAVSTVTVGKLFTRMDGFSYFIYFSAALAKINVCNFVVKSCLKKINEGLLPNR